MLILQFTGLSGAGKTTLAMRLKEKMEIAGLNTGVVDGDVYRRSHCMDLGYSRADRIENIKRLGAIASQMEERIVIIAAINPFEEGRAVLRSAYSARLIYLRCDLATLFNRDTKGLYRRAILPESDPERIVNLTGVNDTFEEPFDADLVLDTGQLTEKECIDELYTFILELV